MPEQNEVAHKVWVAHDKIARKRVYILFRDGLNGPGVIISQQDMLSISDNSEKARKVY